MSRRAAREIAMSLLYEYSIKNEINDNTLTEMADVLKTNSLSDENIAFLNAIVDLFLANKNEIDLLINESLDSWSFDRLSKIDLSIMRIAVSEYLYTEVPVKIICNEAIEMSKRYSTDKSSKFINGILGKIIKEHSR